jgi:hypothetical protein
MTDVAKGKRGEEFQRNAKKEKEKKLRLAQGE